MNKYCPCGDVPCNSYRALFSTILVCPSGIILSISCIWLICQNYLLYVSVLCYCIFFFKDLYLFKLVGYDGSCQLAIMSESNFVNVMYEIHMIYLIMWNNTQLLKILVALIIMSSYALNTSPLMYLIHTCLTLIIMPSDAR